LFLCLHVGYKFKYISFSLMQLPLFCYVGGFHKIIVHCCFKNNPWYVYGTLSCFVCTWNFLILQVTQLCTNTCFLKTYEKDICYKISNNLLYPSWQIYWTVIFIAPGSYFSKHIGIMWKPHYSRIIHLNITF
jgi:hypothetical protein